jgi:ornithine--oxo-acid transaminase
MQGAHARSVALIGAASALGAPNAGCADGPRALVEARLAERLRARSAAAEWSAIVSPRGDGRRNALGAIGEFNAQLASLVYRHVRANDLPVVIGGDHSCAIGTWSGVSLATADTGPFGLIWIDAHMDCHTPGTSESGAVHGMPLASLLGDGPRELCLVPDSQGAVAPEHVCLIGVRSFEPAEQWRLARLGVRVYTMADVQVRGLKEILREAHAIVSKGTIGYGITIDIDAIDPLDAPGTGSREAGGIAAAELISEVEVLVRTHEPLALEVAEFDPHLDQNGRTASLVVDLVERTTAPLANKTEKQTASVMLEERYAAPIYEPFSIVLTRGSGVHVWDEDHHRYLDMLGGYSALSLGHSHPEIVRALTAQAQTLTLTSRAYRNDKLPLLLARLSSLTGLERMIPANTGLEAVEAALKAARKWAYRSKGVESDQAEIIACNGNFHGRSIAIVGMSSEAQYREDFGPFPRGFTRVPFGDADALRRTITPNTAAFLVEPIQGEGGILVPPKGYLAECAEICRENNVLLICDEVQTGLGRTGAMFACDHEDVLPDGIILGKALGGGVLPVSAFVARHEVTAAFRSGDHGSTFGGNPLAAAVALTTLDVIERDGLVAQSRELGQHFLQRLREIPSFLVGEVRGVGLLIGMDLRPEFVSARVVCETLHRYGILSKDTHGTVVRFAPPLVITKAEIDWAVERIAGALRELEGGFKRAA